MAVLVDKNTKLICQGAVCPLAFASLRAEAASGHDLGPTLTQLAQ